MDKKPEAKVLPFKQKEKPIIYVKQPGTGTPQLKFTVKIEPEK